MTGEKPYVSTPLEGNVAKVQRELPPVAPRRMLATLDTLEVAYSVYGNRSLAKSVHAKSHDTIQCGGTPPSGVFARVAMITKEREQLARAFLDLSCPIRRGHARDYRGKGWRMHRKQPVDLPLFVAHVSGGEFALGAMSPKFTRWFVVDVDAGQDLEARHKAISELLGLPSAVFRTPGGGIHMIYLCNRTTGRTGTTHQRNYVVPRLEAKLRGANLAPTPGRIEILPRTSSNSCYRLPFGPRWPEVHPDTGRMLDPVSLSALHEEPWDGMRLFLDTAQRFDWPREWGLASHRPTESPQQITLRHIEAEVPSTAVRGAAWAPLLAGLADIQTRPGDAVVEDRRYEGRDFLRLVKALHDHGLQAPGQRHLAALKLGSFLRRRAVSPEHAADLLERWLRLKHNGQSKDFNADSEGAVRDVRAIAISRRH